MDRFPMKSPFSLAILLALTGCASAPSPAAAPEPVPEQHAQVVQHKALAAQHWGAIAADVAARTKQGLSTNNFLDGRPLYVAPSTKVAFDQAFSNFMMTALVEAGLPVSVIPDGAVEIKYETQLIQHHVEFDPRRQGYVPGAPARVGASFWVMRNAGMQDAATPVGNADKDGRAHMWPTSAELVVTTSIVDSEQYLQRTTDAYYIEQADAELFKNNGVERTYKEWKVAPQ